MYNEAVMAKKSAKEKKAKRKRTTGEKLWLFVKIQFLLMLLFISLVAYYYVNGYASEVKGLRDEAVFFVSHSSPDTFRSVETSIAYDANGETISVMKGEKDVYYKTYAEIPPYVRQAIISIEDKRFYQHKGVDYKSVARAAWAMFQDREVTQGGSTITQQLARNTFLTRERTWQRKVEELYIAVELEKKYSKADLLEFYLNNIYFGNGYYGIGAAAKGYFNKDLTDLTLSESAFLCAIPNSPVKYDPFTGFDDTMDRRNRILDSMLAQRMISEGTFQDAMSEEVVLTPPPAEEKHNYLATYTYNCATEALMEQQGFEFRNDFASDTDRAKYEREYRELYIECNESLYTGGYRIYTSLDMGMQDLLQDTIDKKMDGYNDVSEDGIYELQSAAVCIENSTGLVKALVGGRSQELEGYTLNRAYQSFRQPGSAIKPLVVYTPAFEDGYYADFVLVDEEIEGGPVNADGTYAGEITLRRAVEISKNTVAYKLLEEIGPKRAIAYLLSMDFSHIQPADYSPIIAVGGFTVGVSPMEMAAAYATIENDGSYRRPTCIVRIEDTEGNPVYENEGTEKVIYEQNAARQMTDVLISVMTEGLGQGLGLEEMPCAGKTGTTNGNKDGWFCGYTPYYTTTVWVGYDMPKPTPGLSGSTFPGQIWHNYMEAIHEGLPVKEFMPPAVYIGPEDEEGEEGEGDEDSESHANDGHVPEEEERLPLNERFEKPEEEERIAPEDILLPDI